MNAQQSMFWLAVLLALCAGFIFGFVSSTVLIQHSFENMVSNLRVEKVEFGFNETYIMDRFDQAVEKVKIDNGSFVP